LSSLKEIKIYRNYKKVNGFEEKQSSFYDLERQYINAVRDQAIQLAMPGSYENQLYSTIRTPPNNIKDERYQSTIWKHRKTIGISLGLTLALFLLIFSVFSLFVPQSIEYSFSNRSSCTSSPLLFPSLFKSSAHDVFLLHRNTTISIGHSSIYS
jgi:hypothetical protein